MKKRRADKAKKLANCKCEDEKSDEKDSKCKKRKNRKPFRTGVMG